MSTTARAMTETLRSVIDLIESLPGIPLPYVSIFDHRPDEADLAWNLHINGNAADATDQKAKAAAILKAIGGRWDKDFDWGDDDRADFRQSRDGFNLRVTVARSAVCERVVVGEEAVTLPAVEAAPERTEVREIVEWRCEPVLAEVTA